MWRVISRWIKLWKARCKTDAFCCNPDFATVKSSAWTCQSNEKVLSLDLVEKEHFDDEVMMDLMRGPDSRVPSHCLMDQTRNARCKTPTLYCNSDFATVTSSAWTCQSNEKVLSRYLEERNHFDYEVMMDLMRGSASRVPSHFLMDHAIEGATQNRRCFCNPDFAAVKSSAWTCQSNEHLES